MGNLGAYEEFTTIAKGMGGVETYLDSIAAAAVSEAAPKLIAKGAGATAVVVVVVTGAVIGGKALLAKRRDIQKAGQDARSHLRAMAEEASSPDPAADDTDATDTDQPAQP